jgi:hypothetical protein
MVARVLRGRWWERFTTFFILLTDTIIWERKVHPSLLAEISSRNIANSKAIPCAAVPYIVTGKQACLCSGRTKTWNRLKLYEPNLAKYISKTEMYLLLRIDNQQTFLGCEVILSRITLYELGKSIDGYSKYLTHRLKQASAVQDKT